MDVLDDHQRRGSHQPLDTETHWAWRNPLNVIPLVPVLGIILAAIGLVTPGVARLAALVAAVVWGG